MKESRCRTCGKKVSFVKDENGKTQILDLAAPVYTTANEGEACFRCDHAYVSHFATCPQASAHSKRGGKS